MPEVAAVQHDKELIPGADFVVDFIMQNNAGGARDLTGATAISQMRRTSDDKTKLWDLTESTGIVLGGEAGTVVMTVPGSTTTSIKTSGVYDIQITLSDGGIEVPIRGDVKYVPRVSV